MSLAKRFDASVDHLANEYSVGSRLLVALDGTLMAQNGLATDDIVRLRTARGRSILARLDAPNGHDDDKAVIRLDRFMRQALKVHLNGTVSIEKLAIGIAPKLELRPATDVSLAHELLPHIKRVLVESRTPVSMGAVLYIPFPGSQAGTTYEVSKLPDGPGYVGEKTHITLQPADSHLTEGAFDVTFEDIGGLGHQIKLVRELVQLPLKFPQVYRQLGINPPRGIILYGPPGAGKTHLARALANEIEAQFFYLNGPDVVGTFTGETEGNLRRIFAEASHHAPSLIFIDEMDALTPKRGESGLLSDTRAVTQLLSLMDGLTRVDSVIVIGTTNRVDAIDPAFRRPGRFDREIFVGPPDVSGRREVLDIHTREMPLSKEALHFLDDVARRTHGFVGADLMELCREAGLSALRRSDLNLVDHRMAFKISPQDLRVERDDFQAALSHVRPSAMRETFLADPDVGWNDIGGLAEVKLNLQELVEQPLRNPAFSETGLTPYIGILLYGPSGTGKTLLARAIAKECGVNFITVDGPELFNKWLGESEEAVRNVFRIARQVAPSVIFLDQLDSVAPIRGTHSGSMTTERVVNQILAELDGMEPLSRLIVIGATNRIDLVDPAMLRPGRFGVHLPVPLPDSEARRDILRIHLRGPSGQAYDTDAIVNVLVPETEGFSGARLRQICQEAKRRAVRSEGFRRAVAPTIEHAREALEMNRKQFNAGAKDNE